MPYYPRPKPTPMLKIETDKAIKDLQKHFWGLRKSEADKATTGTLNDTIKSAQVVAKRLITKGYNIKPAYVRTGLLPIKKATKAQQLATLSLYNRPLSLGAFNGITQNEEGVLVSIQRRKKVLIKGAFILEGKQNAVFGRSEHSGNPYRNGVFVRRYKRKTKAKKKGPGIYSPDMPIGAYRTLSLINQGRSPVVFDKMQQRISEYIVKRGIYRLSKLLNK